MFDKIFGDWGSPKQVDEIDPRATKLIIEREEGKTTNIDSGKQFFVKGLGIGRSQIEAGLGYYSFSDLSRTESIQVLMRTDLGLKNINLPEGMLTRIAQFIREDSKPRTEKFDCASFAYFVNEMPYKYASYENSDWEIIPLNNEKLLQPGDTIAIGKLRDPLSRPDAGITHFAIYLGDGLYLSKFGDIGKLIVSTLNEMKRGFGGDYSFLMIPKR